LETGDWKGGGTVKASLICALAWNAACYAGGFSLGRLHATAQKEWYWVFFVSWVVMCMLGSLSWRERRPHGD
jgi:hypothetical protein